MSTRTSLLAKQDISDDDLKRIVENAKQQDEKALTQLCEYAYGRIFTFAYYRLNNRADAEDLTSEVVLKVLKGLESQKGNFKAWMYRVARNAVIDSYRRRAVRAETSLSDIPYELPNNKPGFEKVLFTKEMIKKALQVLTEEQTQLIVLKFIEGYNNEDIAQIMKKSVGAVKTMQFRALSTMRKFLEKKGVQK